MNVIGITGNIAVGKTTFCKEIEKYGYPVFYTDKFVKKLYKKRSFIKILYKYFPEAISKKYFFYKLDMELLKKIIFNNFDKNLDILEKLIHHKVKKHIKFLIFLSFILRKKYFFLETAILFESNLNNLCDYIVYLTCSPDIQKNRFMNRKGVSEDLFIKFNDRQNILLDKKINNSDIVVDTTNLTKNNLKKIVKKILS